MRAFRPGLKRATFLLLLVLVFQLATGIVLFYLKTGMTADGLLKLYRPDLFDEYARRASWDGLVKTVLPHIFAMGFLSFVISHFLHFNENLSHKWKWFLGSGMGASAAAYNVFPFLMAFHSPYWVYPAYLTFFFFELALFASFAVCVWSMSGTSDFAKSSVSSRFRLFIKRPSASINT